jgi:hypothetical protein
MPLTIVLEIVRMEIKPFFDSGIITVATFRIFLPPPGIVFGLEGFFTLGTLADFPAGFYSWMGLKKTMTKPTFLFFHPGSP